MPTIKGTASVSDSRALERALRSTKFPENFRQPVDLSKIHRPVLTQWIEQRITAILGLEDEIVQNTAVNLFLPELPVQQLDGGVAPTATTSSTTTSDIHVDPRKAQIDLTAFLGEAEAARFSADLWDLMLDAADAPMGIPRKLLEEKKKELASQQPPPPPVSAHPPPISSGRSRGQGAPLLHKHHIPAAAAAPPPLPPPPPPLQFGSRSRQQPPRAQGRSNERAAAADVSVPPPSHHRPDSASHGPNRAFANGSKDQPHNGDQKNHINYDNYQSDEEDDFGRRRRSPRDLVNRSQPDSRPRSRSRDHHQYPPPHSRTVPMMDDRPPWRQHSEMDLPRHDGRFYQYHHHDPRYHSYPNHHSGYYLPHPHQQPPPFHLGNLHEQQPPNHRDYRRDVPFHQQQRGEGDAIRDRKVHSSQNHGSRNESHNNSTNSKRMDRGGMNNSNNNNNKQREEQPLPSSLPVDGTLAPDGGQASVYHKISAADAATVHDNDRDGRRQSRWKNEDRTGNHHHHDRRGRHDRDWERQQSARDVDYWDDGDERKPAGNRVHRALDHNGVVGDNERHSSPVPPPPPPVGDSGRSERQRRRSRSSSNSRSSTSSDSHSSRANRHSLKRRRSDRRGGSGRSLSTSSRSSSSSRSVPDRDRKRSGENREEGRSSRLRGPSPPSRRRNGTHSKGRNERRLRRSRSSSSGLSGSDSSSSVSRRSSSRSGRRNHSGDRDRRRR